MTSKCGKTKEVAHGKIFFCPITDKDFNWCRNWSVKVALEFLSAWVFAAHLLRVLESRVSIATVDSSGVRLVHSLIDLHKLLHQSDLFS